MYKDGLKLRQRKKKKRKYNRKIPTATWHPPQLQVLKFRRGTYVTPPPAPQEDLMWGNLRHFGIWIPLSGFPISGPGGYFQKTGWRCAARFLKPLPYFRPKYVILPTLFQTWPLNQYPRSDQCKKHSRLLFRSNDQNWYSILDQNG